jgi:hypothetical protein
MRQEQPPSKDPPPHPESTIWGTRQLAQPVGVSWSVAAATSWNGPTARRPSARDRTRHLQTVLESPRTAPPLPTTTPGQPEPTQPSDGGLHTSSGRRMVNSHLRHERSLWDVRCRRHTASLGGLTSSGNSPPHPAAENVLRHHTQATPNTRGQHLRPWPIESRRSITRRQGPFQFR